MTIVAVARCADCGRPVSKGASRCRSCSMAARNAARSDRCSRGHPFSTDKNGRRYCRVCTRDRRRNSEILPALIPRDRLVPLIERRWTSRGRTLGDLAKRARISTRAVEDLMRGDRANWKFTTADKLICALDVFLWYAPPPDGLGDLYGVDLDGLPTYDPGNEIAPATRERPGARQQGGTP